MKTSKAAMNHSGDANKMVLTPEAVEQEIREAAEGNARCATAGISCQAECAWHAEDYTRWADTLKALREKAEARAQRIRELHKENDRLKGLSLPKDQQRLMDLVRQCRHDLHENALITDEEFAALAMVGAESARRLESYDEVAAKLTNARQEVEALREERDEAQDSAMKWKGHSEAGVVLIERLTAEAVDAETVTGPQMPAEAYESPRAAIADAIRWNQTAALDPVVSEDARTLRDTYKAEAKKLATLEGLVRAERQTRTALREGTDNSYVAVCRECEAHSAAEEALDAYPLPETETPK